MIVTGKRRGFTLIELLIVISVILLLVSMLLPMVNRLRNMGTRMKCQKNMKTLGELITSITDARKKPKSDKLKEEFFIDLVFNNLEDSPGVLICPASTDDVDESWNTATEPPTYNTSPKNCSYFGPVDAQAHSILLNADSDEPIAGEHYLNHSDGVNVLFGDTHVSFYEWKDFGFAKDSDPTNPFGSNWDMQDANIDLMNIDGTEG